MDKLPKLLWQRFGDILAHHEKILLALLSIIIVLSGTIWYRQATRGQNGTPTSGGTYVEGITGGQDKITAVAAKLTKAGLFTFDQQGNLQNLLIDSWTVNADKTEYHFHLLSDVDSSEILSALNENSQIFGQAIVQVSGQDLSIKLAESDSDVPILLTEPMFNYGPYKLSKMSGDTAILTRNTRSHSAPAYLNKIVIQNYANEDDLKVALNKGRVDGATLSDSSYSNNNYDSVTLPLPEYYVLLLNINRAPFRDSSYRSQIINAQSGKDISFTLTVENSQPFIDLANTLVKNWKNAGIDVQISLQSVSDIQNKIAPTRDFQALLTGVNYGYEYNPYYIWSSTQIRPPGNNLTGVKDDKIDATLSQIAATTNVVQRQTLVMALHQLIKDEAVGVVLQQQAQTYVVSKTVGYASPVTAVAAEDKWNAIGWWWQK